MCLRKKEMKQVEEEEKAESTNLDWRGRPSDPNKHGGIKAASFVLGMYYSTTTFFMFILLSK